MALANTASPRVGTPKQCVEFVPGTDNRSGRCKRASAKTGSTYLAPYISDLGRTAGEDTLSSRLCTYRTRCSTHSQSLAVAIQALPSIRCNYTELRAAAAGSLFSVAIRFVVDHVATRPRRFACACWTSCGTSWWPCATRTGTARCAGSVGAGRVAWMLLQGTSVSV